MRFFQIFILIITILAFPVKALAETTTVSTTTKMVAIENISGPMEKEPAIIASDLGVKEPKTLPTSKWYWFKDAWRGLKIWLTRNPEKKAEKILNGLNEKLLEAQKLSEKNQKEQAIKKHLNEYIAQAKDLGARVKKMKNNDALTKKIIEQEFIRQRILDSLYPKLDIKSINDYKTSSVSAFKELILAKSDKAEESIKDYIEKNAEFSQKGLKDIRSLDKIKNTIQDEGFQKKLSEIKDYAIGKISESVKNLNQDELGQKISKIIGADSTTTTSSTKSIIEQIKEEKLRIEREMLDEGG